MMAVHWPIELLVGSFQVTSKMKMILFPNPNPPFNLCTRYPAWFHEDRPLAAPGVKLGRREGRWYLQTETEELTEAGGQLTATDCDILHEGVSVYSVSCDGWIQKTVRRGQEVGDIPAGVEGTDYYVADSSTVIKDHVCSDPTLASCEFFDAFRWKDGIVVNMARARLIHMDAIRAVRNAQLAALDIPFMRAIETGDTSSQAVIATQKQTMRDIPQTFDLTNVRTPTDLKSLWPNELPRH
jgi:hypothetical protein